MKQVQHMMSRWIKGFVTTASMFVFSVSLASGGDITTAPNTGTPYSYSDPNSTAPSYNNVGRPVDEESQSLMLNNQALGLTSPVTVSTGYSANYGYEMNASFSHMLGFYDAVSLLGAYAPQENRVDITWAHAWTEKQRTKLSVERLEEAMDFDYDSGSVTEWVPQYSYGAGYQYLFNKNWLKNVELTGYYAKAQSQDLDTIRFTGTDGNLYDNYRHIAGATSKGSEATLNVSPWKTGLVGLGLNYDSVNYDTKYEDTDAENAKGFGFTLSLEQLLSKHVKLDLEGSQREVYDDYVAGVSFLTPSNLEVGVNSERTLGENGSASDSRFNLNLAYFFDDKNRYQNGYNLEDPSQNDLASWASKSVAYMDEVLAAADQQTIKVTTPDESSNPMLQTDDTTPVIDLTVGEINHVDISDYIESANLTESQKQATPVIKGGPSNVEFTYDNATKSLVTKTEVPESVVNETFEPLVLVFPTDTTSEKVLTKETLRDVLTDSLTFKVTVGAGSTAPTLNSSFVSAQAPILSHAQTWVFKYQNTSNPTDPLAMFINTNPTFADLKMSTSPTKYPVVTGDTNKCYGTPTYSDTAQTLTVTGIASSVCPGNATITVKTTNGYQTSPVQTITFTALPAGTPVITPDAITTPTILEGQTYSPGYTFTTTEVDIGTNETFDTDNSKTYVKVFDAGTNGAGCTDVTSGAGWKLGFTNNNTQAILESTNVVPESLTGHQLKIYLKITNNSSDTAHNSATNFGSSETNCSGTPFTATVQGAPHIPDNIPLGSMKVDTSYTYDFMTDGGSAYNVNNGSSPITSVTGSTITVKNSAGTEVISGMDLSSSLGLKLAQQGSDAVLTGIVNPGYAGDTVYVTLTATNQYGTSTNSEAPAFSETITANSTNVPTINSVGNALTATVEGNAYSYVYTTTPMTAGSGEFFDTTLTKATVIDTGNSDLDVSSQFALTFNGDSTNSTAITGLTTSAATVATLKGPLNVTYTAVNLDDQSITSSTPDTIGTDVIDITDPAVLTPATVGTTYPVYSFKTSGGLVVGSTGLSLANSTVVLSDASAGLTATLVSTQGNGVYDDVQVSGTPLVGHAGTVNLTLNLKTPDGLLVKNSTATLLIDQNATNAPTVGSVGNALTATVEGNAYTYTYTAAPMTAGTDEFFNTTETKATVIDTGNNDLDVSSQFALTFNGDSTNSTAITGLTTSAATVATLKGPLNVTYTAVNLDGQSITSPSDTPDTIGTDVIDITDNAVLTPTATVGDVYPGYSFKTSGGLVVGSTGLSLANSSVVLSDPNAGLTATLVSTKGDGVYDDIQVSGTPLAGHAGTVNLTLNLKTPDGLLIKDSTASLVIDQNATNAPTVGSVGNSLTATLENNPYTYTYTATPMNAGSGEFFDTTLTKATVIDTGNNDLDVSSQFTLTFNGDSTNSTAITGLSASAATVATLKGPLNVTYTAVNLDGQSITSPSDTPDTIGTDVIDITDNAVLTPTATVGDVYSGYSFKTSGGLVVGSTGLSLANSSVILSDPNAGLTATLVSTKGDGIYDDIQVSGTPLAGHAGTITFTLNLQTPDGLLIKDSAATLSITTNDTYLPIVNTAGVPLDQAVNGNLYTYTYATSPMLAGPTGSGEVFNTDTTTVTVVDSGTSQPVTGFTLTFSADKTAITGLNAPASSIANLTGPLNVTYTAVNGDGISTTSTAADTIHVANKPSVVTTGVALDPTINGSAYVYSYATSPMSAGTNEAFDTVATTVTVVDTGTGNPVSGFTLGYNAGNTAITSLNASVDTVNSLTGPLAVIYNVTNADGLSIDSTAADTIATDAINVTATSLPGGTVSTTYTDYSFKTSGGLTVGSTGMSPDVSLGGLSSATFSDPNAGLTAIVQNNDVIVSGTPLAGHAGTLTLTLNLKTPDGLFTKSSTATLTIAAATPTVIPGDLPAVQLNQTYNYTFANTGTGGASGPVVSAGAGEYFDEDATTFTVTGESGNDKTNLFHLEYSSNASLQQGNTASHNHNVVSLVSNDVLTSADNLTVSFHVVNADAQNVNGTPGTIAVGSVTGYLSCPPSAQIGNDRPTTTTSNLYSSSTGGSILDTVTFNRASYDGSKAVQLYVALITVSGNQTTLTCKYNNPLDTPTPYDYISTTTITTVDANGVQGVNGWNSTTSPTQCNVTGTATDTSCQVSYTYAGQ